MLKTHAPGTTHPIALALITALLGSTLGCGGLTGNNDNSDSSDGQNLCARALQPALITELSVMAFTVELSGADTCSLIATHPDDTRRTWFLEVITNPAQVQAFADMAAGQSGSDTYQADLGMAAAWVPNEQRLITVLNTALAVQLVTRDQAQIARLSEASAEEEFGGRWREEAVKIATHFEANPARLTP